MTLRNTWKCPSGLVWASEHHYGIHMMYHHGKKDEMWNGKIIKRDCHVEVLKV